MGQPCFGDMIVKIRKASIDEIKTLLPAYYQKEYAIEGVGTA
jgi:hypothetical protein